MTVLNTFLKELRSRVHATVRRALVTLSVPPVSPAPALVQTQVSFDGLASDIPVYHSYGFAGVPMVGGNVVLVQSGSGGLYAVACYDSASEPQGMAPGDSVQYDTRGQELRFSSAGVALTTTLPVAVAAPSMAVGAGGLCVATSALPALIAAQVALCKDSAGAPLNVAGAFAPGWESAGLSTVLKA